MASTDFESDPYVKGSPETAPFWAAAARNQLILPFCSSCLKFHWYPRMFCPLCGSGKILWNEASGDGTIFSFSTIPGQSEKLLAYVTLMEGPLMLTNILDAGVHDVSIGAKVSVRFLPSVEGRHIPFFVLDRMVRTHGHS